MRTPETGCVPDLGAVEDPASDGVSCEEPVQALDRAIPVWRAAQDPRVCRSLGVCRSAPAAPGFGLSGTFRKLFQALFQGPLFQKSHQKVNFSHTHIFTSFPAQNTWIILEKSVPCRGIVCGCVWDVLVL